MDTDDSLKISVCSEKVSCSLLFIAEYKLIDPCGKVTT
jgi:hypothetical protein